MLRVSGRCDILITSIWDADVALSWWSKVFNLWNGMWKKVDNSNKLQEAQSNTSARPLHNNVTEYEELFLSTRRFLSADLFPGQMIWKRRKRRRWGEWSVTRTRCRHQVMTQSECSGYDRVESVSPTTSRLLFLFLLPPQFVGGRTTERSFL